MAGGGKGGGGGPKESAAEKELAAFASEIRETSRPVRNEVFGQTLEALTTGGIGARIPIIQRGVEASRASTASALRGLDERMLGLAGTPFGEAIRANVMREGNLATNLIPTQIASEFIGAAPNLALGASGQALGGLGTASGLANQRAQMGVQQGVAKGNQTTQILGTLGTAAALAAFAT